jgi:hypothetical protein
VCVLRLPVSPSASSAASARAASSVAATRAGSAQPGRKTSSFTRSPWKSRSGKAFTVKQRSRGRRAARAAAPDRPAAARATSAGSHRPIPSGSALRQPARRDEARPQLGRLLAQALQQLRQRRVRVDVGAVAEGLAAAQAHGFILAPGAPCPEGLSPTVRPCLW